LISRFKEKKEEVMTRARDRREMARAEKAADKLSRRTAISEARQLKRESRAKYIKEKYGTYKPLSQKIKEVRETMQSVRAKRLSGQRQTQTYDKKSQRGFRSPVQQPRNLLASNRISVGPTSGINFGFKGPNLGGGSRDILTGKSLKRR